MAVPLRARSGAALLERAVDYTRLALEEVRPDRLDLPTPCDRWSLAELLDHMEDSLAAFTEAAELGLVLPPVLMPATGSVPAVVRLKQRACSLIAAWNMATRPQVAVGAAHVPTDLMAAIGSLEIAVHGWDVAQACGATHPIPPRLAPVLLDIAHEVVDEHDRGPGRRFGLPRTTLSADPAVRLLAFLGR